MAIESVIGAVGAGASPAAVRPAPAGGGEFGESLAKLMVAVERSGEEANRAVERMMHETGDVHEAMIALQQADMALQLTVQVRNKLVQAYQEIMRMPV
jgi:flagellar hook-basal body complex protein FliE